ncbi:hypothetical protein ES703_88687 [subsurface metagenome]
MGNGPLPTLVVYAFVTPIILEIEKGEIPVPLRTPPGDGLDEVTKG